MAGPVGAGKAAVDLIASELPISPPTISQPVANLAAAFAEGSPKGSPARAAALGGPGAKRASADPAAEAAAADTLLRAPTFTSQPLHGAWGCARCAHARRAPARSSGAAAAPHTRPPAAAATARRRRRPLPWPPWASARSLCLRQTRATQLQPTPQQQWGEAPPRTRSPCAGGLWALRLREQPLAGPRWLGALARPPPAPRSTTGGNHMRAYARA